MSSDLAIRAEGLGKAYTIRHQHNDHVTLAQVALDRALHPLRRNAREQIWALKDVSFDLRSGEVLGLVGRNGAGKSTLLKLLSRITDPSAGRVDLWGRVGSLLEVGTGFHPELTGRENVYLNGSILGMTRAEIDRRFDEIVAFAGVERFLDTPVKRYSSGMYVRLAFAIAAHLDSEILLLDEVLAVGDSAFQSRCFDKVKSIAGAGRAVVLVSHNMASIRAFATRAVMLESGGLVASGSPDEVTKRYQQGGGSQDTNLEAAQRVESAYGERVRIQRVALAGTGLVGADDPLRYSVWARTSERLAPLRVGQIIRSTLDGKPVAGSFGREEIRLEPGTTHRVDVEVASHGLAPGQYFLTVNLGYGGSHGRFENLDGVLETVHFEVAPPVDEQGRLGTWNTEWWGGSRLPSPEVVGQSIASEPGQPFVPAP